MMGRVAAGWLVSWLALEGWLGWRPAAVGTAAGMLPAAGCSRTSVYMEHCKVSRQLAQRLLCLTAAVASQQTESRSAGDKLGEAQTP